MKLDIINIVFVALGIMSGSVAYNFAAHKIHEYGYDQFERGANAVVIHYSHTGNFGSMEYRRRVFESNDDPQIELIRRGYP